MKVVATERAEQNRAAIDPWSMVHLSTGLAMGLMKVPWRWALGAAVAYEIVEQFVERRQWGKELFETSGPESAPNAIVDSAAFLAGHWLGSLWLRLR